MGNASAKEGENGHMAASPEPAAPNGGGGSSSSAGGAAARPPPLSPPDDVMLERPPPVPYLFVPQVMIYYPKMQEKEMRERDKEITWGVVDDLIPGSVEFRSVQLPILLGVLFSAPPC
jgi:hypothetical protein